jgi:hypothetical protein
MGRAPGGRGAAHQNAVPSPSGSYLRKVPLVPFSAITAQGSAGATEWADGLDS